MTTMTFELLTMQAVNRPTRDLKSSGMVVAHELLNTISALDLCIKNIWHVVIALHIASHIQTVFQSADGSKERKGVRLQSIRVAKRLPFRNAATPMANNSHKNDLNKIIL